LEVEELGRREIVMLGKGGIIFGGLFPQIKAKGKICQGLRMLLRQGSVAKEF
jgi:hypothetical protein